MINKKINTAIRLDIILLIVWAVVYGVCYAFDIKAPFSYPFGIVLAASVILSIILVHYAIKSHVFKPIKQFLKVADNVIDTSTSAGIESLDGIGLGELESGFKRVITNLIDSHVSIEGYIRQISSVNDELSNVNEELKHKVDVLNTLYYTGQIMGDSLSISALARNFLTVFTEKLSFKGAGLMLYNKQTDTVNVRDIVGMSPDLYNKLKFDSSNPFVNSAFVGGFWSPDEKAHSLMQAEFETDAVKDIKLVIPIRIKDHFVGLLLLSQKQDLSDFKQEEIELYQAIVSIASTAINNAQLYESSEATKNELDKKVFNLMTLQQSSRMLSSTLNLEELITMSLDMFLETVWANCGILMLKSDESISPKYEIKSFKGLSQDEIDKIEKDPSEEHILKMVEKEKKPILSQNISGNSYQLYTVVNKEMQFAAYVPMLKEDELYGIVKVGKKINGQPFTDDDLEFFSTIASQAVIAFENARLYSLAITDSITKLYLNRYFHMRLEEEVSRSKRYNSTISLLMLDIDHFKLVNDTYGHQQGDAVLKGVSRIIKKNVRNTDIPARYGGEEFVVILPETTIADAKIVADRIRQDIADNDFDSVIPGNPPIKCTISIGVASFPLNAETKDGLIQKSDIAMYKAKNSGRNKVALFGIEE